MWKRRLTALADFVNELSCPHGPLALEHRCDALRPLPRELPRPSDAVRARSSSPGSLRDDQRAVLVCDRCFPARISRWIWNLRPGTCEQESNDHIRVLLVAF